MITMLIRRISFIAVAASIVTFVSCSSTSPTTEPAVSAAVPSAGTPAPVVQGTVGSGKGAGGAAGSVPAAVDVSTSPSPSVSPPQPAVSGAGPVAASAGANAAATGVAGALATAPPEAYLKIAPLDPSQGFMLRNVGADIPAGQDVEYCEIAQLPGSPQDVYWVNEFELGNSNGSHHLIVSAATPGSVGESKIKKLKVGEHMPCLGANVSFGEDGIVSVAAIQTPYDRFKLPDGVGRKLFGGQYVVFDYHFLNTSSQTVRARSAIAFHTTSESNVKHESLGLSILNYTIATPPNSSKSFTAECHLKQDVMIGGLARHTHQYGTDYDVWFSGGAKDGQHIWTSKHWEEETQHTFPAPILMKAGEGFRFRCAFDNPTNKALRFGTSATDEMCILFASMWEAHDNQGLQTTTCSIIWIDDEGIGHPADEAGGIPPSPLLAEATCALATGSQTNLDAECKSCMCSTCGTPAINCALDAECSPIVMCQGTCAAGEDCIAKCQDTQDQHSSGVGLALQAAFCIRDNCKTCPAR